MTLKRSLMTITSPSIIGVLAGLCLSPVASAHSEVSGESSVIISAAHEAAHMISALPPGVGWILGPVLAGAVAMLLARYARKDRKRMRRRARNSAA